MGVRVHLLRENRTGAHIFLYVRQISFVARGVQYVLSPYPVGTVLDTSQA